MPTRVRVLYLFLASAIFYATSANSFAAQPFKILFIGNSYTYFPSPGQSVQPDPDHPYLPLIFKSIVESKQAELHVQVEANTEPGYSFENHAHNAESVRLLQQDYDAVVLQAQSSETFDLPKWFKDQGKSYKQKFFEFGRQLVELTPTPAQRVFFEANWFYNPRHEYFRADFPGLRFEAESPKHGELWYGESWEGATAMIENSFRELARVTGANVAPVGRAWLLVKQDVHAPVPHDALYWDPAQDASHPSYRGSYLAACVLYGAIFHDACAGAAYEHNRMSSRESAYLQKIADSVTHPHGML